MRDAVNGAIERQVIAVHNGTARVEPRELVEEVSYQVFVTARYAGRFSCSPWKVREAAIGWLFMNGYIRCMGEISSLEIHENSGEIQVVTEKSAGPSLVLPSAMPTTVSTNDIFHLSSMLEERSLLFHRTGGVHCAALAQDGEFLAYEEDVSRHAAVDKVAGACLQNRITMADSILVFSGRIPGEIIRKMEVMGCSMVIARSAPTDHACRLAEKKISL